MIIGKTFGLSQEAVRVVENPIKSSHKVGDRSRTANATALSAQQKNVKPPDRLQADAQTPTASGDPKHVKIERSSRAAAWLQQEKEKASLKMEGAKLKRQTMNAYQDQQKQALIQFRDSRARSDSRLLQGELFVNILPGVASTNDHDNNFPSTRVDGAALRRAAPKARSSTKMSSHHNPPSGARNALPLPSEKLPPSPGVPIRKRITTTATADSSDEGELNELVFQQPQDLAQRQNSSVGVADGDFETRSSDIGRGADKKSIALKPRSVLEDRLEEQRQKRLEAGKAHAAEQRRKRAEKERVNAEMIEKKKKLRDEHLRSLDIQSRKLARAPPVESALDLLLQQRQHDSDDNSQQDDSLGWALLGDDVRGFGNLEDRLASLHEKINKGVDVSNLVQPIDHLSFLPFLLNASADLAPSLESIDFPPPPPPPSADPRVSLNKIEASSYVSKERRFPHFHSDRYSDWSNNNSIYPNSDADINMKPYEMIPDEEYSDNLPAAMNTRGISSGISEDVTIGPVEHAALELHKLAAEIGDTMRQGWNEKDVLPMDIIEPNSDDVAGREHNRYVNDSGCDDDDDGGDYFRSGQQLDVDEFPLRASAEPINGINHIAFSNSSRHGANSDDQDVLAKRNESMLSQAYRGSNAGVSPRELPLNFGGTEDYLSIVASIPGGEGYKPLGSNAARFDYFLTTDPVMSQIFGVMRDKQEILMKYGDIMQVTDQAERDPIPSHDQNTESSHNFSSNLPQKSIAPVDIDKLSSKYSAPPTLRNLGSLAGILKTPKSDFDYLDAYSKTPRDYCNFECNKDSDGDETDELSSSSDEDSFLNGKGHSIVSIMAYEIVRQQAANNFKANESERLQHETNFSLATKVAAEKQLLRELDNQRWNEEFAPPAGIRPTMLKDDYESPSPSSVQDGILPPCIIEPVEVESNTGYEVNIPPSEFSFKFQSITNPVNRLASSVECLTSEGLDTDELIKRVLQQQLEFGNSRRASAPIRSTVNHIESNQQEQLPRPSAADMRIQMIQELNRQDDIFKYAFELFELEQAQTIQSASQIVQQVMSQAEKEAAELKRQQELMLQAQAYEMSLTSATATAEFALQKQSLQNEQQLLQLQSKLKEREMQTHFLSLQHDANQMVNNLEQTAELMEAQRLLNEQTIAAEITAVNNEKKLFEFSAQVGIRRDLGVRVSTSTSMSNVLDEGEIGIGGGEPSHASEHIQLNQSQKRQQKIANKYPVSVADTSLRSVSNIIPLANPTSRKPLEIDGDEYSEDYEYSNNFDDSRANLDHSALSVASSIKSEAHHANYNFRQAVKQQLSASSASSVASSHAPISRSVSVEDMIHYGPSHSPSQSFIRQSIASSTSSIGSAGVRSSRQSLGKSERSFLEDVDISEVDIPNQSMMSSHSVPEESFRRISGRQKSQPEPEYYSDEFEVEDEGGGVESFKPKTPQKLDSSDEIDDSVESIVSLPRKKNQINTVAKAPNGRKEDSMSSDEVDDSVHEDSYSEFEKSASIMDDSHRSNEYNNSRSSIVSTGTGRRKLNEKAQDSQFRSQGSESLRKSVDSGLNHFNDKSSAKHRNKRIGGQSLDMSISIGAGEAANGSEDLISESLLSEFRNEIEKRLKSEQKTLEIKLRVLKSRRKRDLQQLRNREARDGNSKLSLKEVQEEELRIQESFAEGRAELERDRWAFQARQYRELRRFSRLQRDFERYESKPSSSNEIVGKVGFNKIPSLLSQKQLKEVSHKLSLNSRDDSYESSFESIANDNSSSISETNVEEEDGNADDEQVSQSLSLGIAFLPAKSTKPLIPPQHVFDLTGKHRTTAGNLPPKHLDMSIQSVEEENDIEEEDYAGEVSDSDEDRRINNNKDIDIYQSREPEDSYADGVFDEESYHISTEKSLNAASFPRKSSKKADTPSAAIKPEVEKSLPSSALQRKPLSKIEPKIEEDYGDDDFDEDVPSEIEDEEESGEIESENEHNSSQESSFSKSNTSPSNRSLQLSPDRNNLNVGKQSPIKVKFSHSDVHSNIGADESIIDNYEEDESYAQDFDESHLMASASASNSKLLAQSLSRQSLIALEDSDNKDSAVEANGEIEPAVDSVDTVEELDNSIELRKRRIESLRASLLAQQQEREHLEELRQKAMEKKRLIDLEEQLKNEFEAEAIRIKLEKERILLLKFEEERENDDSPKFKDRLQLTKWVTELTDPVEEEESVLNDEEELNDDSWASGMENPMVPTAVALSDLPLYQQNTRLANKQRSLQLGDSFLALRIKQDRAIITVQSAVRMFLARIKAVFKRKEVAAIREMIAQSELEGNLEEELALAEAAEVIALDDSFASDIGDQMKKSIVSTSNTPMGKSPASRSKFAAFGSDSDLESESSCSGELLQLRMQLEESELLKRKIEELEKKKKVRSDIDIELAKTSKVSVADAQEVIVPDDSSTKMMTLETKDIERINNSLILSQSALESEIVEVNEINAISTVQSMSHSDTTGKISAVQDNPPELFGESVNDPSGSHQLLTPTDSMKPSHEPDYENIEDENLNEEVIDEYDYDDDFDNDDGNDNVADKVITTIVSLDDSSSAMNSSLQGIVDNDSTRASEIKIKSQEIGRASDHGEDDDISIAEESVDEDLIDADMSASFASLPPSAAKSGESTAKSRAARKLTEARLLESSMNDSDIFLSDNEAENKVFKQHTIRQLLQDGNSNFQDKDNSLVYSLGSNESDLFVQKSKDKDDYCGIVFPVSQQEKSNIAGHGPPPKIVVPSISQTNNLPIEKLTNLRQDILDLQNSLDPNNLEQSSQEFCDIILKKVLGAECDTLKRELNSISFDLLAKLEVHSDKDRVDEASNFLVDTLDTSMEGAGEHGNDVQFSQSTPDSKPKDMSTENLNNYSAISSNYSFASYGDSDGEIEEDNDLVEQDDHSVHSHQTEASRSSLLSIGPDVFGRKNSQKLISNSDIEIPSPVRLNSLVNSNEVPSGVGLSSLGTRPLGKNTLPQYLQFARMIMKKERVENILSRIAMGPTQGQSWISPASITACQLESKSLVTAEDFDVQRSVVTERLNEIFESFAAQTGNVALSPTEFLTLVLRQLSIDILSKQGFDEMSDIQSGKKDFKNLYETKVSNFSSPVELDGELAFMLQEVGNSIADNVLSRCLDELSF